VNPLKATSKLLFAFHLFSSPLFKTNHHADIWLE